MLLQREPGHHGVVLVLFFVLKITGFWAPESAPQGGDMQVSSSVEQGLGVEHRPSHPVSGVFHARPLLEEQRLASSGTGIA